MEQEMRKRINSDDIAIVEEALKILIADKEKSLSELFDVKVKPINDKIYVIPFLEHVVARYIQRFSSILLAKLFAASFREITDTYHVTLRIATELIRRKDKTAQSGAIRAFIIACSAYKPDHRQEGNVVYDQLINEYFPRFESGPLIFLLMWWQNKSTTFLYSKLKLKMEVILIRAMTTVVYEKNFRNLLEILTIYLQRNQQDEQHSNNLIQQIETNLPEKFHRRFGRWKRNTLRRIFRSLWLKQLIADLDSPIIERVEHSVNQIHTLIAREWKITSDVCKAIIDKPVLKWHTKTKLLYKFIEFKEHNVYGNLIIRLAHEDFDRLKKQLSDKYDPAVLGTILRTTLNEAAINHLLQSVSGLNIEKNTKQFKHSHLSKPEIIDHIRQWVSGVDGISAKAGYGLEITAMLYYAVKELDFDLSMYALKLLDNYSGNVILTERRIYHKTFVDELKSTLLLQSTNHQIRALKLLAINRHKIKLDPQGEKELKDLFKKYRISYFID